MSSGGAKDMARDLAARFRAAQDVDKRATSSIAAAVQGHRGDSTVSVASSGSGATVTITGPDAAAQRADVHKAAQAALRKAR